MDPVWSRSNAPISLRGALGMITLHIILLAGFILALGILLS